MRLVAVYKYGVGGADVLLGYSTEYYTHCTPPRGGISSPSIVTSPREQPILTYTPYKTPPSCPSPNHPTQPQSMNTSSIGVRSPSSSLPLKSHGKPLQTSGSREASSESQPDPRFDRISRGVKDLAVTSHSKTHCGSPHVVAQLKATHHVKSRTEPETSGPGNPLPPTALRVRGAKAYIYSTPRPGKRSPLVNSRLPASPSSVLRRKNNSCQLTGRRPESSTNEPQPEPTAPRPQHIRVTGKQKGSAYIPTPDGYVHVCPPPVLLPTPLPARPPRRTKVSLFVVPGYGSRLETSSSTGRTGHVPGCEVVCHMSSEHSSRAPGPRGRGGADRAADFQKVSPYLAPPKTL